jgi:hypothetical protein
LYRLYPIFVQVCLPLPSGRNPDAVNKYHNILLIDGKVPARNILERHTRGKGAVLEKKLIKKNTILIN